MTARRNIAAAAARSSASTATGKYESKVECKPGRGVTRLSAGEGKEEFKRNGCEVKREWKQNGEYKEEVKCD